MSKIAEQKAQEYEKSLDYYHYTSDNPSVAYQQGYEQDEKDYTEYAQYTIMKRYENKTTLH